MICSIHDVAYPESGSCWCCDAGRRPRPDLPVTPIMKAEATGEKPEYRVDAPLPPRELTPSGNLHCGKHDSIYTVEAPCRGCEIERAAATEGNAPTLTVKGPDDTLAEFRGNALKAQATADAQNQHIWPRWFRDWLKDFRP